MTTPTRPPRRRRVPPAADGPRPGRDPDGGHGDIHDLLTAAVDEAARLLDADGAMVYLVDAATGHLRFAHDAGIRSRRSRDWVRSIDLPVGVGMFGRAVGERTVVLTPDYLEDPAFTHAEETDRVVRDIGIRSMVVAPMVAGDEVYGALGTFSSRADAFSAAQIGLVRALADHAAVAMSNARLIEALDGSRGELAKRADIERTLREIGARISAAADFQAVVQLSVDEAARLLRADGARIDLVDDDTGLLRGAYESGALRPGTTLATDPEETLDQGVAGQAVVGGRPFWTGDYLTDSRFKHLPVIDEFIRSVGINSVLAAPLTDVDGTFGALTVSTGRPDAWAEADAALLATIADQASIAIRTRRLIAELDRSRGDLARTADAERTLREIASRVSATHDQDEILQAVIDASVRLLGATGAMIDLLGETGMAEAWSTREAGVRASSNVSLLSEVTLAPDAGVSGRALRTRRVEWTGSYLEDERFRHTPARDAFVRDSKIRSVIAAPLIHRDIVVGAITVYGDRPDAFGQADAGLLSALADQAAVAIANARLIDELERSRAEVARRADAEQTLREIAARVSAILEPAEVLQRIVDETTRLLQSDGARIDLYDPSVDALIWSYAAGDTMAVIPVWAKEGGLKPGQAVAGTAFLERRPARTDDYLADERFVRDDAARTFVEDTGIRSVIAVPLPGEAGPIGTLSVVSRQVGAYDDADGEVLTALATQAAIAIRNARLIEELARSRAVIERRAEAEQALREIAARITAIRRPGDLLQRIVDEALRLLRADGAVIDEFDATEGVLVTAYDAGLTEEQRESVRATRLRAGEGLSGKAMAEGRVIAAGDYLAGHFRHVDRSDELARTTGIGDLIVAPIIGDEGPLGAIEVYRREVNAFDDIDAAVLGGLADQAAIAITNARLIEELERSQAAVARRADTERALRDITARIAALREPEVILDRVVEEARRLLGSDGAHLTRMSEDGTYLVPVVVTPATGAETLTWLLGKHFPLDGGINGLAASRGTPVWTDDYAADARIPHDPDDVDVASRMGLVGMAAAPLRAPGGEVIGTLAISSSRPRSFDAEELDLLQGLADQAAIAITNSTLLGKLTESEERYRYLIENAPDIVWSIGADTKLTFVSDAAERLTGFRPDELVGRHFGELVHPSSHEVAELDWAAGMSVGSQEVRGRVNLLDRDGTPIPAEFVATARLDESGQFIGANGSVRDMRDRDRLERELTESEERFRQLVQTTPDVIYRCDADGRFLFVAEGSERLFGRTPAELVGMTFGDVTAQESLPEAMRNFAEQHQEHDVVRRFRYLVLYHDGTSFPAEISSVAVWEDGQFAGVQGTVRDVTQQERLERELRESQERYRFLVENSPDVVFSTDAEGRFTFMSESMERMTGWRPEEVIGGHFSMTVDEGSHPAATARWIALVADPATEQVAHIILKGPDGRLVPVEVSSIGMVDAEGRFAGIHGSTRDISERSRLERELRRQAGELAAGEERAHLARELHDSVTQALFSMTLVSRSVEMLLDRDAEAARTQLAQLRDLQREALAEMRALIFELRPGNLEQDGLTRALRTHTAALQGRIGLPVVVESTVEERLPLSIEEVLYRIAQEALHNVVKHANARQVRVELGRIASGVRLRISDDGRGFDPERGPAGHLGLTGMRARATKIGARFTVRSVPGSGTTIEVTVSNAALAEAGTEPPVPAGGRSIRDG